MELKLSPETLEFIAYELEEMLCHCDLTETQGVEIATLLAFLDRPDLDRFTLSK